MYQTWDQNDPGHSDSWGKLTSLKLPSLDGKSFLDVGCNEGFFCAYAIANGASRVVGLDYNPDFIAEAKRRVPEAEFINNSWDALPPHKFDVILLSSALHYASEPLKLLDDLVAHLTPPGTLVVETPVFPTALEGFHWVSRPVGDRVLVPGLHALKIFSKERGLAFRQVGPSVMQTGDESPRMVYQIGHYKRTCWLLLQPTSFGKSTKAAQLMTMAGTELADGDSFLASLIDSREDRPLGLRSVLDGCSSSSLVEAYDKIAMLEVEGEFVTALLASLPAGVEPIVEAYFPTKSHKRVLAAVRSLGFNAVQLRWKHPITLPQDKEHFHSLERFDRWLSTIRFS